MQGQSENPMFGLLQKIVFCLPQTLMSIKNFRFQILDFRFQILDFRFQRREAMQRHVLQGQGSPLSYKHRPKIAKQSLTEAGMSPTGGADERREAIETNFKIKIYIFRRHLCLKNHIYKVDFCFLVVKPFVETQGFQTDPLK